MALSCLLHTWIVLLLLKLEVRSTALLFKWSNWDLEVLEGFVDHAVLVLRRAPSRTPVMFSEQWKAPVMGTDHPCVCPRSWGDSFTCHKYWKYWRLAWGIESDEETNMDLMGTELAWMCVLQSSRLYRLTRLDDFTLFMLPMFIKEVRKKCVTAAKALSVRTGSFLLASQQWEKVHCVKLDLSHPLENKEHSGILH